MGPRHGARAQPDAALLALLLQRASRSHQLVSESDVLTLLESRDEPCRSIAVTDTQALDCEARATHVALHGDQQDGGSNAACEDDNSQNGPADDEVCVPALLELDELTSDLLELHARGAEGDLSPLERELADALMLTVAAALVQAALSASKQPHENASPLGSVRVWLLELAVRPASLSRQLAFTLFFNVSVRAMTTELGAGATDAQLVQKERQSGVEQLASQLFLVLLEMLGKAVVVVGSSRGGAVATRTLGTSDSEIAWIAQALSCVLLFTRNPWGRYCADRLRALDPQIVRFFLRESSQRGRASTWSSELDDQLLELLVVTMYAQESSVYALSDVGDELGPCHARVQFALSPTALERFGGLELLLTVYYTTPSLAAQRLLFLVFFDVACHQQQQAQRKTPDAVPPTTALDDDLWRVLQRGNVARAVTSAPCLFAASSTPCTAKKLYAQSQSQSLSLSEKHLHQFMNHLRAVLHVDEYFVQSPSLRTTITVLKNQATQDVAEALMAKVTQLLASSRAEDRFQGERWLAELVSFGVSLSAAPEAVASSSTCLTPSTTRQKATANQLSESVIFTGSDMAELEGSSLLTGPSQRVSVDELEETCCFDEDAGIRIAARTKFWELARSASATQRESFMRTLSVFVRRKLGVTNRPSELTSIAREISACLNVAVQQQERSVRVLAPLLLLVIDVCKTRVSRQDLRRQDYDRCCARRNSGDGSGHCELLLSECGCSDSLAARFASGEIALDAELLGNDLATSAALLLAKLHDSDATLEWGDRIHALLPLAGACNTRVAVAVSRLVVSVFKRKNESEYMVALRELHARAVDADDAMTLALAHLHVRELVLHKDLGC
ncbi:hypothetical protein PybrP1_006781 [[Pythium] brassicae (nom. inval.)]|nr:hypothetical protein PybrP1_006781 [[Pythium] brassicae (nom. inval.)]